MAIYLSLVSGKFPENYHIGVNARMWGVTDPYAHRLDHIHEGDTLVLMSGGVFKSIHRIESGKVIDSKPLWPAYNGDYFRNRFRISAPEYVGEVRCADIWHRISFMQNTQAWGGTIQGPNGVMNSRMTAEDLDLLKSLMEPATPDQRPAFVPTVVPKPTGEEVTPGTSATMPARTEVAFLDEALQFALERLLPQLGLRRAGTELTTNGALKGGAAALLCQEANGTLVVVQLHRGRAPTDTLLDLLFDMSQVRQRFEGKRDVRGIILGETMNAELTQIMGAVPNVAYRNYRVALELAV